VSIYERWHAKHPVVVKPFGKDNLGSIGRVEQHVLVTHQGTSDAKEYNPLADV